MTRIPRVVVEAVRAIHDEPIPFLFPQIAALLTGENQEDALIRRALNANFHLGKPENVETLAKYAANADHEMEMRQFALAMVGDWDTKSARDQVLGVWRPIMNKHNGHDAVIALKNHLPKLMKSGQEIRTRTAELAAQFGLSEVNQELVNLLWEKQRSGKERAGALLALMALEPDNLESECDKAVKDDEPRVRAAGRIVLTSINPTKAVPTLIDALKTGDELERQSANRDAGQSGTRGCRQDADEPRQDASPRQDPLVPQTRRHHGSHENVPRNTNRLQKSWTSSSRL